MNIKWCNYIYNILNKSIFQVENPTTHINIFAKKYYHKQILKASLGQGLTFYKT